MKLQLLRWSILLLTVKKNLSDTKIAVKNGQSEQVLSVWPTELVDQIDIGSFRAAFK